MVAIFSGMAATRITMNTDRIANSEGIIVIKRADGLRNTSRKPKNMTPAVSAKLSVSVGSRRSVISPETTPLPATVP